MLCGAAEITVEFKPAQQHLRFFANFAAMAEKHPEWFSAAGDPNFLLVALTLCTYRNHLYLAGIPAFLQKALFAIVAPIARLRGYRVEIEPNNWPGFPVPKAGASHHPWLSW